MPAVRSVLVIGAGAAGTATAILLAEDGVSVDLVDVKPDVSAVGSGITLMGNALRVFRQLGVWSQVAEKGYAFDSLGIRAPDPNGTLVAEIPDARTGGPDLPATVGMYRPDLARILVDRAVEAGAKVRFNTTPTALVQDENGVDVTFADGSSGRYDLVVGADGVRSWTRDALGIQLETRSTGMGIWRTFVPRPDAVTRTDLVYGGPCYIAGYCPTGERTMYAYLVEKAQDRTALTPEESLAVMRELSEAYHGPWDEIRESLTDPATVNYTWFEEHVLPAPWHRGRAVVIGDAAHTCPPTIAQGAAMALEDASVITDLLVNKNSVDDVLWAEFAQRRYERVKVVVECSHQLALWWRDRVQGDVPGVIGRVAKLVAQPE